MRTPASSARLAAIALALAAAACEPMTKVPGSLGEPIVQKEIEAVWTNPSKNAAAEQEMEAFLHATLSANLDGVVLPLPSPFGLPYVDGIEGVNVELGTKSPKLTIPGQIEITEFPSSRLVAFPWAMTWSTPNGGVVEFDVDIDHPIPWIFPAFFPPDLDHHVRLHTMSAQATGTLLAIVPKNGGPSTVFLSVKTASIGVSAQAEGWFWTIDVSSAVRKQINAHLLDSVVKKTFQFSIDQTF